MQLKLHRVYFLWCDRQNIMVRSKLHYKAIKIASSLDKKCGAIKIASVLIVSRVNLQKWLRDKQSYVYVVAM